MSPKNGYADWEVTQLLADKMGLNWNYTHASEIMDEIARLDAFLRRRFLQASRRGRLGAVAVQ